jgi:TPR repeat protein
MSAYSQKRTFSTPASGLWNQTRAGRGIIPSTSWISTDVREDASHCFFKEAERELAMRGLSRLAIVTVVAIALWACAETGSNGAGDGASVEGSLAHSIYTKIMERWDDYDDLTTNKKALAACINWQATGKNNADVRYSYVYYESEFTERKFSTSQLMEGAINGCQSGKKEHNLDCDCVAVDRNGSPVLRVPKSVSEGTTPTGSGNTAVSEPAQAERHAKLEACNLPFSEAMQLDAATQYERSYFCLEIGDEVRRKWSCLAAHSGFAGAQLSLGVRYKYGYGGVQSDAELSYLWSALAAKNGTASATDFVDRLRANMSPDQIAEAERQVAEWKPNPEECEIIGAQAEN